MILFPIIGLVFIYKPTKYKYSTRFHGTSVSVDHRPLCSGKLSFVILKPLSTNCMVFNIVFNTISLISQRPVHLSMLSWSSFNQYSTQYSVQATGCFPTKPLSKTTQWWEEWILPQWPSSILGKNIARARDRTNDFLFSSQQCYQLSYRARQKPLWNDKPIQFWKQW